MNDTNSTDGTRDGDVTPVENHSTTQDEKLLMREGKSPDKAGEKAEDWSGNHGAVIDGLESTILAVGNAIIWCR